MSKDHAEYLSEEQIAAEVAELAKEIASGKKDEDELERDAYFSDPKNADEIEAMLERMMQVIEDQFGSRIKLSQTTPKQQGLLELAILELKDLLATLG